MYGDPAYVLRPWIQVGFSRKFETPPKFVICKAMNSVHLSVEHSSKYMKQIWSSQDYKRILKVHAAPISLMYKGASLLWICKVCMGQCEKL